MGKNTLTLTINLRDDLPAGVVGIIQKIILKWMEEDTRFAREGEIVCTVGDVAPVNPIPMAELLRVLPTYNTVGAELDGYEGNLTLWKEDLNTVSDWYFAQIEGEGQQ